MAQMLKGAAKAGSAVAKKLVARKKNDSSGCCDAAEALFHESLGMYRDGVMKWPDMVKDLNKSLMALKPDGSNDGENDGAQTYEE